MLTIEGKRIHFNRDRCIGCGACLADCHPDSLAWEESESSFTIRVNHDTCILCRKCVNVCPAGQLPEHPLQEADFDQLLQVCLGAARDEKTRFEGSSGGVARTLARAALETGFVDAVYGVKVRDDAPHYVGGYFFQAEELSEMANSVYSVFPFAAGLKQRPEGRVLKRLLFIGTACQIQAAQNFYRKRPVEVLSVAIFCKHQKSAEYVQWLRKEMGQSMGHSEPRIRYRGEGWPGQMRSGEKTLPRNACDVPFGMELWREQGCRFCPNAFGFQSDMVISDPWDLVAENNPGLNLVSIRTKAGMALWQKSRDHLLEYLQIPEELAARPLLANRPLSGDDIKTSIGWWRYRRTKVDSLPYYLGQERNWLRKAGYAFLDLERRFNSWFFMRFKSPMLRYLLMRFWGKSSKVILMLVGKG